MKVPCSSYKAISSATQIRSKIEAYLKRINGGEIQAGPLGPRIEDAYSKGLIDSETKDRLEKILVECETILFNMRDGDPIEFNEILGWMKYVDALQ